MIPNLHISPDQFRYDLPEDRIALFPAELRDHSKLLIWDKSGKTTSDIFYNIGRYLPEGANLFFNNSKVIPARLVFEKQTGSKIEIFCLRPAYPVDYAGSLSSAGTCAWTCMIGNLKRYTTAILTKTLYINNKPVLLKAEKTKTNGNIAEIRFSWDNNQVHFCDILEAAGDIPLPPYIKRELSESDAERYQTIYSKYEGSVAAPTAGLHFTETVMDDIRKRKISTHEVTLHVGAGTFQPVKSEIIADHEMHDEFYQIDYELLEKLKNLSGPLISVGTTTVRTLESLYWTGVKLLESKEKSDLLTLGQWECYSLPGHYSVIQSVNALQEWMDKSGVQKTLASTRLMIVPGYEFKITEILVTNFHQPRSTLLMLIAAFVGNQWKEIYEYALENDFRFLSYGDSSLLFRKN